jgi:glutamate carboxypeptidase
MSLEAKTDLIEHLGRQHEAMVSLLAGLVGIDSGSYNKRGVDAVESRLRAWLEAAGIGCEAFPNPNFGGCLMARLSAGGGGRPIVLMGHCDTVFPDGTAAQRPFRIDGNRAFGPGVCDMKAGLVMNSFVLEALRRFGAPCPLHGLYTADEEIASPSSGRDLGQHRWGTRHGRDRRPFPDAQHHGKDPRRGARDLQLLHQSDIDRGAEVVIGQPVQALDLARHCLDGADPLGMRSTRMRGAAGHLQIDKGGTLAPRDEVAARPAGLGELPGSDSRILREGSFLPLEQDEASRALLDLYARSAAELGLEVAGEATGGSADSGFTAALGTPTLCGTGPVGGDAHTDDEWCRIDTMVPRAQALALTILAVAAG